MNAAAIKQAVRDVQRMQRAIEESGMSLAEFNSRATAGAQGLSPAQASELYEQLTGKPVKRQRWQQWGEAGDIESRIALVLIRERRIPRAEVERLAREGLPHRGKGGRPRKDQAQ